MGKALIIKGVNFQNNAIEKSFYFGKIIDTTYHNRKYKSLSVSNWEETPRSINNLSLDFINSFPNSAYYENLIEVATPYAGNIWVKFECLGYKKLAFTVKFGYNHPEYESTLNVCTFYRSEPNSDMTKDVLKTYTLKECSGLTTTDKVIVDIPEGSSWCVCSWKLLDLADTNFEYKGTYTLSDIANLIKLAPILY